MKRWQLILTTAGVLLLMSAWGLHKAGWFSTSDDGVMPSRSRHLNSADAMDTPSGWIYRQNQPHHWRYIMLQK